MNKEIYAIWSEDLMPWSDIFKFSTHIVAIFAQETSAINYLEQIHREWSRIDEMSLHSAANMPDHNEYDSGTPVRDHQTALYSIRKHILYEDSAMPEIRTQNLSEEINI